MIIVAIIVGLITVGLIFLLNHISSNGYGDMDTGVFFWSISNYISVLQKQVQLVLLTKNQNQKQWMYIKAKTTLEYTIRDGEVIDSVVVWKRDIDNED